MSEDNAAPLDENTRRYYLDVMGVQCWQSLEVQTSGETQNNISELVADKTVDANAVNTDSASTSIVDNRDVAAVDDSGHVEVSFTDSIQQCTQCTLHKTRKQALAGRGNLSADLMFVLLSPTTSDDESGVLCSGEAYELFAKMLAAIKINVEDIYLSSLLKCAVPKNNTISTKEIQSCLHHLKQQIQQVKPKHLVVLGETAARCLLQKDLLIDDYREMNASAQYQLESLPIFVSYSPQELLSQPQNKRKAWSDLQQLQKIIGGYS